MRRVLRAVLGCGRAPEAALAIRPEGAPLVVMRLLLQVLVLLLLVILLVAEVV